MNAVVFICQKELKLFFDSLFAYILLALFLGISGIFTWMSDTDIFIAGPTSLSGFFSVGYWSMFFFTLALTMRMFTKASETERFDLYNNKSVSNLQLVLGKFLGAYTLVTTALLFTLPYVFTLAYFGNLDQGQVLSGYLALLLLSGAYISIGLWASSITGKKILAFPLAITIGLFFHIISALLASKLTGPLSALFTYLSMSGHYERMARGVLDSRDIIYFLSIMLIGLILSVIFLIRRNIVKAVSV